MKTGDLIKVLRYLRRYWLFLGLSLLFAAVTVLFTLYVPVLTGQAVDLIVGAGRVDFAGGVITDVTTGMSY